MTNILFVGGFYPPKLLKKIHETSKGKAGLSNHNFEMSIINGLKKQNNINLKIITAPKVYSFPHNNNTLFTRAEFYDFEKTPVKSIGFINIVFLNKLSIVISLIFNLLRLLSKFEGEQVGVIMNTPNIYMECALFVVKKMTRKELKTILIIPDIPVMVSQMNKTNVLKKKLVGCLDKYSLKLAEKFDAHVLLTSNMQDFFDKRLKFIVMEGIVNENLEREAFPKKDDKHIILYTGTLRKVFGILNLLDAFEQGCFFNTELWICGSGETSSIIKERAEKNPNIVFWGLVEPNKALEFQDQATILVNPRTSEGEYTKYSFPSKTMEYLQAGKVVIANKLPGIPDEYADYLVVPEDESVKALTDAMRKVLSMDAEQRELMGRRGKEFVLSKKNSYVQTKRMLNLLQSV